ncbi:site-specific integrase [Cellulosimicrobium sp. ES-005]|uniref:Site-specific integrase n=1 Tax=Cellulosimicrobium sp. ES-005 TaxID=3163031 RepID=A0AAU8G501_9MICO
MGPDAALHYAAHTFGTKLDAEAWLIAQRRRIDAGTWTAVEPVAAPVLTLGEYAETWLERRDLRPTTARQYRHYLDSHILPTFAERPLADVTPTEVARWEATLRRDLAAAAAKTSRPDRTGSTAVAHAYALLRTIYRAAVREDLVSVSPCRVEGAGQARRAVEPVTLEPHELAALAAAIRSDLSALVLLAGWGALRLGELLELRRADVDLKAGTVRVVRQVQHLPHHEPVVGPPKTDAGRRTVHLPPHVVEALRVHLAKHAAPGPQGLLFHRDGAWWAPSTLRDKFRPAAAAIGKPALRVHGLRHSALTLAARTGATTAELMARAGHTSPQAALRYQHAAQTRDAEIAAALAVMASATVSLDAERIRRAEG